MALSGECRSRDSRVSKLSRPPRGPNRGLCTLLQGPQLRWIEGVSSTSKSPELAFAQAVSRPGGWAHGTAANAARLDFAGPRDRIIH